MPEGPETEAIVQFIDNQFVGKELTSVKIMKGRYINHGVPANFKEFNSALPLKLESIDKKGKVIFFHFSNDWVMISRLGMTGWWYIEGNTPSWRSEVKSWIFNFGNKKLIYSDPRSYGTLSFTKDKVFVLKEIQTLAPDIMAKDTTYAVFKSRLQSIINKKPHMTIEELLSDQKKLVSGIGNYLKSEIMYAAKIAPMCHINDINEDEWNILYKTAKQISRYMMKAIINNKEGEYEAHMHVYNKKIDPLGNIVKRYTNKAGRTVHWVSEVQK